MAADGATKGIGNARDTVATGDGCKQLGMQEHGSTGRCAVLPRVKRGEEKYCRQSS
jgi:hypothetical protein